MKTIQNKLDLRYIERKDIPLIISAEKAYRSYWDEDFEVEALPEHAMTESRLVSLISTRRDEKAGTYDTRGIVAVAKYACGCIVWEMHEDEVEVVFITAHPDGPPEITTDLLKYVMAKVDDVRSRRRKAVFYVRDGEYGLVKQVQELKWTAKLVPEHFENGDDAWKFTYESKQQGHKKGDATVPF